MGRGRLTGRLFLLGLAAAAVTGCGATAEKSIEVPYRQVPVTVRDIVVSASAAGVIEPVTTVEVKSKASGEIIQVLVEEGDEVKAGQLLVRVDPRIPRNAVTQAEADSVVAAAELTNAESQFRRAEALYAKQSITEQEFEDARLAQASAYARLTRTRSALEDAQIAFEDTEVRAPSAGTILSKNVEVGTVIASASREIGGGTTLLRMASLDTVQVRGLVDETDIGKIRAGMPVTIAVDAFPNRKFEGNVLRVGAEAIVEQNVTQFPVLVHIDNTRRMLRPGMNAEVEIHVGSTEGALAVPASALHTPRELVTLSRFIGLKPETVQEQLKEAGAGEERGPNGSGAPAGGAADSTQKRREMAQGQRRPEGGGMPPGGGGMPPGGFRRGGGPGGRGQNSSEDFLFGGHYAVFVAKGGNIKAVPVRTGLTDFAWVAVLEGLVAEDSVLILPTAGLLESQEMWQNRAREMTSGPLQSGGR